MRGPNGARTLQLDEDLPFQRREWRTATVLWFILLGLMLATGLGLFGNGPLSHGQAGQPGGELWIDYERFARFGEPNRLIVHARPQPEGTIQLRISRSLVEAFAITAVTPEPISQQLDADGLKYRWSGAGVPAEIVFDLEPIRRWQVEAVVGSPSRTVQFSQFIYP
jgi:hypothetical protein